MLSLFERDITLITLSDVRSFLGLQAGTAAPGLAESAKVDFKQDWPGELAKKVAAFANGGGGVIVVGVEERNGKAVNLCGVARGNSDSSTRVFNQLAANVTPIPFVEVAVLPLETGARDVVLIRIPAGDLPPYLVDGHIQIRIGDKTAPADAWLVEQLFARRDEAHLRDPKSVADIDLVIKQGSLHHSPRENSNTFMRIGLASRQRLQLRFDSRVDELVAGAIRRHFGNILEPDARRGADYTTYEHTPSEVHHQRWRVRADGAIAFATQVRALEQAGVASLWEMAVNAARFSRVARDLFREFAIAGDPMLCFELQLGVLPLDLTLPNGMQFKGIGPMSETGVMVEPFAEVMRRSKLESEEAEWIAGAFVHHLRHQRNASVSLTSLEQLTTQAARLPLTVA
ncbi:MAG: ATP-binding protein [Sandaracinaceae bacterium]|nr:ATP-binding protein [Sandaracinaceae bacterium]